MPNEVAAQLPSFAPLSLIASNVGTWERDPERGLIYCDATMAEIYGLSDAEARGGFDMDRLKRAVHPVDRPLLSEKVRHIQRRGGLMVLEYRTTPAAGEVRWVLVRGRYEPIRPGHPMAGGRGIIIDITESMPDGREADEAFFLVPPGASETTARNHDASPLIRAADAALDLRQQVGAMPGDVAGLEGAVDRVLLLLGHRLAQGVPRAEVE